MIEHVGFVTNDQAAFERFWVDFLGYVRLRRGELSDELTMALFGIPGGAETVRYTAANWVGKPWSKPDLPRGPDVEIHLFARGPQASFNGFDRRGINHVSLLVKDKQAFAANLPPDIEPVWYHNPGGWYNLFVRDYDGNWIEIRD